METYIGVVGYGMQTYIGVVDGKVDIAIGTARPGSPEAAAWVREWTGGQTGMRTVVVLDGASMDEAEQAANRGAAVTVDEDGVARLIDGK